MKKVLSSSFYTIFGLTLMLLFGSNAVQAQYSNLSKKEVKKIIKNLEVESDIFRRALDDYLDDSRLDSSERETRYNTRMKDFEKAVDDLKRHFDVDDRTVESRAKVQELLNAANPVNEFMNREDFNRTLQTRWNNLRRNMNKLARNYQLSELESR